MAFAAALQAAIDQQASDNPVVLMRLLQRARDYLSYLEQHADTPGWFERRGLMRLRLEGDERAHRQAAFIRQSRLFVDCADYWLETGAFQLLDMTDDLQAGWNVHADDVRMALLNIGAEHQAPRIAQRWYWLVNNYICNYFGQLIEPASAPARL